MTKKQETKTCWRCGGAGSYHVNSGGGREQTKRCSVCNGSGRIAS